MHQHNQQKQQAQAAPKDVVQIRDTTFFLTQDDPQELKAATAFVHAMYPGSKARIVQAIRVARLSQKNVVIALYRPTGSTPALLSPIDEKTGGRRVEPAPLDVLAKEVIEGKPVPVRDHWTTHGTADDDIDMDGDIQTASFFGAISKTLRDPVIIKGWRADVGMLRLGT